MAFDEDSTVSQCTSQILTNSWHSSGSENTNSLTLVLSINFFLLNCSWTGAKQMSSYESERRPVAVYEFAGSLAIESKKWYSSIYPLTFYSVSVTGQFSLWNVPQGNHGSCIHQNTSPVQDDEYHYHDSLQACLIDGIGHWLKARFSTRTLLSKLSYSDDVMLTWQLTGWSCCIWLDERPD